MYRIFVIGHSLGGTLAPRIAAAEPHPAGMVMLAGMTLPLQDKMLTQTRYLVSLDGQVTDAEQAQLDADEAAVRSIRDGLDGSGPGSEGFILGAPLGYYRDLASHDPPAEAARKETVSPPQRIRGGTTPRHCVAGGNVPNHRRNRRELTTTWPRQRPKSSASISTRRS